MSKLNQIFKRGSKVRALLSALIFVLFFSAIGGATGLLTKTFTKKSSTGSDTEISQNSDTDTGAVSTICPVLLTASRKKRMISSLFFIDSFVN